MTEPKFSVIIPIYNAEKYLRDCLDSLVSQTFVDWEAICVDDGSTDASGAIVEDYASRDSRFKVVHQKNSGVSVARNVAQLIAKGEWLMYLDSDDMYLDGVFDVALRCTLMPYDAILFQNPIGEFLQHGGKAYGDVNVLDSTATNESGLDFWLRHITEPSYPWLRLLRRNTFGDIEFPNNISLMEDEVHLIKCLTTVSRWAKVGATVCAHRFRTDSLSGRITAKESVSGIRAMHMVMDALASAKKVPSGFVTAYWKEKDYIIEGCGRALMRRDYAAAKRFYAELKSLQLQHPICKVDRLVCFRLKSAACGMPRFLDRLLLLVERVKSRIYNYV